MNDLREKVADIIADGLLDHDLDSLGVADCILALPEIAEALAVMKTGQGKEAAEYLRIVAANVKP